MKRESGKTGMGKVTSWAIAALVLVGAGAIWAVADVSAQSSLMSKAFILFIGAIIVLQIVPGLMLLGAMFKGVFGMVTKSAPQPDAAHGKR
jgi:membrane protein YdbS with pleckstrin-like domain